MSHRAVRARLREYDLDLSDAELIGEDHYKACLMGASEWAVAEGDVVKEAFGTPRGHRALNEAILHAVRCFLLETAESAIRGEETADREQALAILHRVGRTAAREAYAKYRNPGLLGKMFG